MTAQDSVPHPTTTGPPDPTVFLHIGHHKTGSSYIQSSLALGASGLGALGISYLEGDASGLASEGKISSGNGSLFHRSVYEDRRPSFTGELYSSEGLFSAFLDEGFRNAFLIHARRYARIKVLLFIRDPVAYACSRYHQAIKREGFIGDLAEFLQTEDTPRNVKLLMEWFSTVPNVELSVWNYSGCSGAVLERIESWLDVPPGTLPQPPVAFVNRSMTFGELAAQRVLNELLGPCGDLLSDFLCNELPLVHADDVRPSIALQVRLWDHLEPAISWVNERLPEAERYSKGRDVRPARSRRPARHCFSQEQLQLIMTQFARHVEAVRSLERKVDSGAIRVGRRSE